MTAWGILGAVSPNLSNWLTPLWLLGVGAACGLALLLVLWLIAFLASRLTPVDDFDAGASSAGENWLHRLVRIPLILLSRRTVREVPGAVREGGLWPVLMAVIGLSVFGVVGVLFVQEPLPLLRALGRLPEFGTKTVEATVPVSERQDANDELSDPVAHEVAVSFRRDEVRQIVFRSNQNLTIATQPFNVVKAGAEIELIAGEEFTWIASQQAVNPFVEQDVERLYVRNLGSSPATLTSIISTAPPHPEVLTIPITALVVAAVFLLYLIQRFAAPRLSAIALATYKSEIAQPLFSIIAILGAVLVVFFLWIPYNTFGEDIKMLKDSGLTLIMILSIVLAVWAASSSISEEIEGRTALTVLSKPIGRPSFIVGKFVGIVWTVTALFVILGLLLLIVVAYKPIYDARESSTQDVTWQLCHLEMTSVIPGLALAFMETLVLAALSVAISTRLPWLANLVICFTIYALGHLTPLIVQSSYGQLVPVQFIGQLIATVFPNLDHFNIQAAVAAGVPVPPLYLVWALVYCLIYSVIAMLLALVLFEDRDLA
ncbi:MAG: ABC transporter permease [Pirellulaceae bacterium]|nr:ABC transporter permease [Pirellulaceae bacterium]